MKIDGRKLSHARLEAIRFQAVKAVQAGQPPTAVARALGLYPAGVFGLGWQPIDTCWRMGCASRAQGERASEAVDGVPVEMDLQYRDIEKSASAAISLCALDESDDRHADSAPIRHQAQCDLGGSIVGANGVELPKAAEPGVRAGCDAGQTMDRAGFPQDSRPGEKGACCRVFLPMRAACDLTFMPGRPGGYAGKPLLSATLANAFISICCLRSSAKGELRFMTSRKRHLSGAVHRVPAPVGSQDYPKKIFLKVVDGLPAHKAKSVHRFVHQVKKTASDCSFSRRTRRLCIRTIWSGTTSRTTALLEH